MVSANHLRLVEPGEPDPAKRLIDRCSSAFKPNESARIRDALAWLSARGGEPLASSSEPLLSHAVATAGILLDFNPDVDCVIGGLLARSAEDATLLPALREKFGAAAAALAEGAARMATIEQLGSRAGENRAAGAQHQHEQRHNDEEDDLLAGFRLRLGERFGRRRFLEAHQRVNRHAHARHQGAKLVGRQRRLQIFDDHGFDAALPDHLQRAAATGRAGNISWAAPVWERRPKIRFATAMA